MTDSDNPSTRPTRLIRIGIAVVLVLIAVSLAYDIRIGPKGLNGLDEQVERNIYSNVRAQIANDIRAQNPGLPDQFIQDQIDEQFRATVNQPDFQDQLDQVVQQQAQAQREMFTNDDTGIQYMQDIDPYYWLYYAENVVETGQPGDSVRNGQQWDDKQLAPQGRPVSSGPFHAYLVAGIHDVLSALQPGISVMESMMWYPIIIFSIIVVLTFLIGSAITNEWGGFFAALAISTLPGALNRTVFGRGDTDALVLFFPLLAIYLFMEAFAMKELWAKITFASLAGFVIGLFSFAWGGWWYPLVFILTTIGIYLVYRLAIHWWPRIGTLLSDQRVLVTLITAGIIAVVAMPLSIVLMRVPLFIGLGIGLGAGIAVIFLASLIRFFTHQEAIPAGEIDEPNRAFWTQPGVWQTIAFTGAFVVITGLSVLLFRKSIGIFGSLLKVFNFGEIKAPTQGTSIFPNVYTTVAELNPAQNLSQVFDAVIGGVRYGLSTTQGFLAIIILIGLSAGLFIAGSKLLKEQRVKGAIALLAGTLFAFITVASLIGTQNSAGATVRAVSVGSVLLALAFLGILAATIGRQDEETYDVRYGILLAVWVAATVYATLLGIRFVLLLTPAFAIAVGAGAGYLIKLGYDAFRIGEAEGYGAGAIVAIALLTLVFFMPGTTATPTGDDEYAIRGLYGQAHDLSRLDIPLVDDTWYSLLSGVRNDTPSNTIITSWWDFGHQFKYYANRPVTFDGASQNRPTAHWVGKLLITRNESESLGTLRMLACSNHFGFERITENVTEDQFETLEIVNTITTLSEQDAQTWLDENGYGADAEFILEQTHCEPPQNLVIASGDMVGKAGVWGHFGTWNFERAAVYNEIRSGISRPDGISLIQDELNVSAAEAFDAYQVLTSASNEQANAWIAGYPSYFGQAACTQAGNETLTCRAQFQQGGVEVRINLTEKAAYANLGNGEQGIPFAMLDNGTFSVTNADVPVNLGFALLPGQNAAVVSSAEHTGSVFQRMYYYDGAGLDCYDEYRLQNWPRGGKINTFSANWSCAALG